MIKKVLKASSFAVLFLMFFSCQDNKVFDEYHLVDQSGWHADSISTFSVDIADTAAEYAVYLKMRHNNNYPYRNIWFFRTIESKRGVEYADTINYMLADEMGQWLGSGIGETKHVIMPLRTMALKFNRTGNYTFSIQHGMRDTVVTGITDIGLEVFFQNVVNTDDRKERN